MKTNVYFISDLHFECFPIDKFGKFHMYDEVLKIYMPILMPDLIDKSLEKNILLLAGDIMVAKKFHHVVPLFEELITRGWYDEIYYTAGNHEYYHTRLDKAHRLISSDIENNPVLKGKMHFLNNQVVMLNEHVQLIASPLWYETPLSYQYDVVNKMNDFKCIEVKENKHFRKMSYSDVEKMYKENIAFIETSLKDGFQDKKQSIIMTHHCPSHNFIKGTKYENQPYAVYGYGTVLPRTFLEPEVGIDNILCWIHGHAHQPKYREYRNEFDILCKMNTVGYYLHEFYGESDFNQIKLTKICLP